MFTPRGAIYRKQRGLLRIMLCCLLVLLVVGASPAAAPAHAAVEPRPALAPNATWVAYNDCVLAGTPANPANTNAIKCSENATGALRRFDTGVNTGVTVSVTTTGTNVIVLDTSSNRGAIPNAGTDAYQTFYGFANMLGGVQLNARLATVTVTFTGLDAGKTYTYATSANRNLTTNVNRTFISIQDVNNTSLVNESTEGASISSVGLSNDTTSFVTANNSANGYVARWSGIQPGPDGDFVVVYSVDTSSGQTTAYGPSVFLLAEEEPNADPAIYVSGTLTPFQTPAGTPSIPQSYTVSAENLASDLTITAPADFGLATASEGPYTTSLILTPVDGVVAATSIYARFDRASMGSSSGVIQHTSEGAPFVERSVSGTATGPTLTLAGAPGPFYSAAGVASPAQNYTISGTYLAGDVTISAPADFTLALASEGPYTASLVLSPVDGTLPSTLVFARMQRAAAGTSLGAIRHESSGAETRELAVTGTAYTWRAYNDCFLSGSANPANTTTIACALSQSGAGLRNFDSGAALPVTVSITAGSVAEATTGLQAASGTDAAHTFSGFANIVGNLRLTTSGASVVLAFTGLNPARTYTFATSANRANSGASAITIFTLEDVANTSLTNASTPGVTISTALIEGDTSAFNTADNTASGYVARWSGVQPGADGDFTVRFTPSGSEGYGPNVFLLAEELAVAHPEITVSGSLSAFTTLQGLPSAVQTYTVTGADLSGPVTISAPDGYELSNDGAYATSLVLPESGGVLAETSISVRLHSAITGNYSGNITHTSPGAQTVELAVSGKVEPGVALNAASGPGGSLTLEPAGGVYAPGTIVRLRPQAGDGYRFSGWSGANAADLVENGDGSWTITLNADAGVMADFLALGPVTYPIDLMAGWNLVSFPVHPQSTAITDVLATVQGSFDMVYAWDASGAHAGSGNWLRYDNEPLTEDTLAALDEKAGFWIHMTVADRLEVTGAYPQQSSVGLQTGAGGWNLVGCASPLGGPLSAYLAGAPAGMLYGYQASAAQAWSLYDPSAPGYASNLAALRPGRGYWMRASSAGVWNLPY